jgi:hypothetical protein
MIGKEKDFVQDHCGKYPVVYLDLKECKGATWDDMYKEVWLRIREMVERHMDEVEGDDLSYFEFHKLSSDPPEIKLD